MALDLLAAFGIRPTELKGISTRTKESGELVAVVKRERTTINGKEQYREVAAAPPKGWPIDCFDLASHFAQHGIPDPSDPLSQQLKRLIRGFKIECKINPELTAYGLRHAFAIRLAELGLNY